MNINNGNILLQTTIHADLPSFIAKSFATVSPSIDFLPNWHINQIADKLMQVEEGKIKRLIINIPPRNLKSICVSVAWSAWLLGHNPATKIMSASYSQKLSNKHSLDCRLILKSKWYKKLFPNTHIAQGEDQKAKFVTTQRGFRFATSTGGTATGEGGDILIVDDPQNPTKINSKKYRESCIQWFEQTFVSRLNDKKNGAIVIVMQRLHDDDLCGYLLKNKSDQWHLLKLPAVYDNTPLHEQREDLETLQRLKQELGEYNFAAQYLQEPIPSTGTMVNRSWLNYFTNNESLDFKQIIQSWDTAIKAKDENDYSAGITIGINDKGYYILDILRIKAEFPELSSAITNYAKKWNPNCILIEDKASGQSLIQALKPLIKYPIIPIRPKYDKVTRFASATPHFEAGKIFIEKSAKWRLDFEQELLSFPKGSHDDQVDSLSQGLIYLQQRRTIQIRRL